MEKEVEKDMTDMKNDVGDDQVQADIKKCLEGLAKNTVMSEIKASRNPADKLSAHRICQIENRLENDESLKFDDDEKEKLEDQAGKVKRKLWTTYTRIRKSSYDLTSVTTRQLDERIAVLKKQ